MKPSTSKNTNSRYIRLYLVPLTAFLVLLLFFGFILIQQRDKELKGLEQRILLQSSLLAEKISSKLNTYEMILQMVELQSESLDLDVQSDRVTLGRLVSQQLLLHDELEGVCVMSADGSKIYSSYHTDFLELEQTRAAMFRAHFEQGLPFAMLSYTHHGAKHMVLSRSLMDKHRSVRAVVALVVETERFYDQLSVSAVPGMVSSIFYDTSGTLFALWNNPVSGFPAVDMQSDNVSEIPFYNKISALEDNLATIQGGIRFFRIKDMVLSLATTNSFPMTLALQIHIPSAMTAFDRSLVLSLSIISLVLFAALLIDHRLVRQTRSKELMQQQMLEELSIKVQQRTMDLEKLSTKDSLTGLVNRRKFNMCLGEEIERHTSPSLPFSIIATDLDGFKQVNDSLGHMVGDEVLIHIASILQSALGSIGTIARWGGDELMVLVPSMGISQAIEIAESLREVVDGNPYRDNVHCTISMGVAEHLPNESATDLIRRADYAMYEAKRTGKNKVVAAKQ
ncbi:MAG: diguanylate cyclase [Sphaerochaeta sp.]|nr:diguanylate cyclase [Sphaerochaeta sp.]